MKNQAAATDTKGRDELKRLHRRREVVAQSLNDMADQQHARQLAIAALPEAEAAHRQALVDLDLAAGEQAATDAQTALGAARRALRDVRDRACQPDLSLAIAEARQELEALGGQTKGAEAAFVLSEVEHLVEAFHRYRIMSAAAESGVRAVARWLHDRAHHEAGNALTGRLAPNGPDAAAALRPGVTAQQAVKQFADDWARFGDGLANPDAPAPTLLKAFEVANDR